MKQQRKGQKTIIWKEQSLMLPDLRDHCLAGQRRCWPCKCSQLFFIWHSDIRYSHSSIFLKSVLFIFILCHQPSWENTNIESQDLGVEFPKIRFQDKSWRNQCVWTTKSCLYREVYVWAFCWSQIGTSVAGLQLPQMCLLCSVTPPKWLQKNEKVKGFFEAQNSLWIKLKWCLLD